MATLSPAAAAAALQSVQQVRGLQAACSTVSRDGKNSYAHKMNHKLNFSQICMCSMVWFNSNYPVAIQIEYLVVKAALKFALWKHLFVTHVEM